MDIETYIDGIRSQISGDYVMTLEKFRALNEIEFLTTFDTIDGDPDRIEPSGLGAIVVVALGPTFVVYYVGLYPSPADDGRQTYYLGVAGRPETYRARDTYATLVEARDAAAETIERGITNVLPLS